MGTHEYSEWHLGLTVRATDETKGRYPFVFGDLRRIHRSGIIACHFRAAEWRHKEVELRGPRAPAVPGREAGITAKARKGTSSAG